MRLLQFHRGWKEPFLSLTHFLFNAASILAAIILILDYGFVFSPSVEAWFGWVEIELAGLFILLTLFEMGCTRPLSSGVRSHWIELVFYGTLVGCWVLCWPQGAGWEWQTLLQMAVQPSIRYPIEVYLCYTILARFLQAARHLFVVSLSPAATVLLSFMFLIFTGSVALSLPTATHGTTEPQISFLDALFTSTSAVCVTGLIVVDTSTAFSRFGQTIIMMLIQFGALGIMTYVGIFSFMLGKDYSLRGRSVLHDMINTAEVHRVAYLMKIILLTMFGSELIGTFFLYFELYDPTFTELENWFIAMFHSISAFGNAGFSTYGNSMESFVNSPIIILTISGLVILGGIGFAVIYDMCLWFWSRIRLVKRPYRLSIHSRLVLWMTGFFILIGMLMICLAVDHDGVGWRQWALTGLFQSVVSRTAGFNSIPLAAIAPWGLLVMMVLMFIGAAPGGTGGGIKVSTVGLLVYSCRSLMKGRNQVEIMRRTIPEQCVLTAFVLCGLALAYLALAIIVMVWVEPDLPFLELVFEVVSAFGTVGLSMGITPELSPMGKIVIIISMYLGRVGPLTVFLAMARQRDDALYRYPSGSIAVG